MKCLQKPGGNEAVTKVGSKAYQNNKYPFCWVTEDGAIVALAKEQTKAEFSGELSKIYPNKRGLHFALAMMPIFGLEAFRIVYSAFAKKENSKNLTKHKFTQH